MNTSEKLTEGKHVFDIEIAALKAMRDSLDATFVAVVNDILDCKGKVIITGMGKPGHIARKIAATLSSLGVSSFFLHPAEAMHGDLGMVEKKDVVIAISYSGESDEIVGILPNIKLIGAKLIAVTGNASSSLAKMADTIQVLPPFDEACKLGLAPTSSTTVALAYGDALAVTASVDLGFKDVDFGRFHPAGSLGKKLITKVDMLMRAGQDAPVVNEESLLVDAIDVISSKRLGATAVVNSDNHLVGIITDGDIRRLIASKKDLYSIRASEAMSKNPKIGTLGMPAVDALKYMREQHVSCLPIVSENAFAGMITWQDIVKVGIVV